MRRLAFLRPTPGTWAIRAASCVVTICASTEGEKVESTERASLEPTPEMARSWSKRARSSRVANP